MFSERREDAVRHYKSDGRFSLVVLILGGRVTVFLPPKSQCRLSHSELQMCASVPEMETPSPVNLCCVNLQDSDAGLVGDFSQFCGHV